MRIVNLIGKDVMDRSATILGLILSRNVTSGRIVSPMVWFTRLIQARDQALVEIQWRFRLIII
jgi:hypothetical protein